jgi:O-antigen ligase
MGKRKHQPPPPAPAAPRRDRRELLRRGLVILVTALVVARPLVLGEDPGLLAPTSDAGGLVLTLLWLLAAAGWAGWRLWSGPGPWHGGLVEAGLLAAAGCLFLSSGTVASYGHPAWLISWEWLGLLLSLTLVRQLAGSAEVRRGLLAAAVATAVAVSAYAVYQAAYELPHMRALYGENRDRLREAWEKETGQPISADDPELEHLVERIKLDAVYGTFAHPNSFAGYLALLLPAAVGYALAAWRRRASTWQPVLAVTCAAVVALALALTRSRGAILATLLVGAAVALWYGRHLLRRHLVWAGVALAVLVGAGLLASRVPAVQTGLARAGESMGLRLNYWRATWAMIRDHAWLGVGPGNFGRYYPRSMVPSAVDEKISDPHNFALDVWAAGGVFALAGLLAALAAFFGRLAVAAGGPPAADTATGGPPRIVAAGGPPAAHRATGGPPVATGGADPVPWDFYLGGMAGLLLAFLLRASAAGSGDEILLEGVAAGGRSVVWFAAFALFWGIPWSGPSLVLALAAGVTACLLNLTVSGGISFPSVAGPLWLVVALALAAVTAAAPGWPLRLGLPLFLPLPVLAGAALTYLMLVFVPVVGCNFHLRQAQIGQALFREKAHKPDTVREAGPYLRYATDHLQQAHKDDPSDVTPLTALAAWSLEVAPLRGARDSSEALRYLDEAKALDPLGKPVRLLVFQARLRQAELAERNRAAQGQAVEAALDGVVAVDPSDAARLHARLAEAWFRLGEAEAGYREAVRAWQEDEAAPGPAYRLPARQRDRVRGWLAFRCAFQAGSVLASAPQGPLHVLLAPGLKVEPPEERGGSAPPR